MTTSSQTDVAARVRNVGKAYRIYDKPQDRLKQMLLARFGRRYGRDFCALHGISLEIKRGEALGIIGRNGSGKSTLLQILAGTLSPSWGEAEVYGRVGALLELGSGFNPEFTGRENVYLAATIAGLNRKQTEERFDAIAAFAEIGEYLEQPVKTYSSGMMMRLAFAVQTAIEPDVLIVDEALSVGDFFFQQKCTRRMHELRTKGTTLLFVSHDMGVVRDLCQRVVYLRRGELVFHGNSAQGIRLYFQDGVPQNPSKKAALNLSSPSAMEEILERFRPLACWMGEATDEGHDQDAHILGLALLDKDGRPTTKVIMGGELVFWILIRHFSSTPMNVSVALKNRFDQVISSFGSYTLGLDLRQPRPASLSLFELKMSVMIEAGEYSIQVTIGPQSPLPNRGTSNEETPWLGPFSVSWEYERDPAPFLGMFGVPVTGSFRDLNEALS